MCDCVKKNRDKKCFDGRLSPSFHKQSIYKYHEFNQCTCILHTLLRELKLLG